MPRQPSGRAVRPRSLKPPRNDRALRVRPIGARRWHPSDIYHQLLRMTWPQVIVLFVTLFTAFNLVFAWLYSRQPGAIDTIGTPIDAPPFWQSFFFSIQTVATIGYGNLYPVTVYANVIVVVEITLGILFFALVTGIAFARFSRPTARVLFSRVAVVSEVAGRPTLMFRAANQRHNLVFEAHATVSVLADEEIGGSIMRRFHDLELVSDRNPVFALSWMIMHPMHETSPVAHWIAGEEAPGHAEIIVVISGTDDLTGQSIHSRWAYRASDICWNARFVDILDDLPDGTRTIDYRRFHDIEAARASA